MTLATRCPSCATIFRMTTQEATARGGTVRCGVCGTAFNALDALVNVESLRTQTPIATPEAVSPVEAQPYINKTVSESTTPDEPSADTQQAVADDAVISPESVPSEPALEMLPDSMPPDSMPSEPTPDGADGEQAIEITESSSPPPESETGREQKPEEKPGEVELEIEFEPAASSTEQTQDAGDTPIDPPSDPLTESVSTAVEPEIQSEPVIESSFADTMAGPEQNETSAAVAATSPTTSATDALLLAPRSQEQAPGSAPGRRGLWVALCALALLVLAAQSVYVWRDALAASWPAARPVLVKTCALIGCRVELPMDLDALVIVSSELQAVPQTTNSYTFNTLLHNRGQQALRYPALELTLTDALDQLVLRRALQPAQYLNTAQRSQIAKGIAPNAELPVRIRFDVAGTAIVGYRVGIFYP